MLIIQVLGLASLGIKAVAVTSMTPKDEVTPLYNDIETDTSVRLVYGEAQYTYLHARYFTPDPLSQQNICADAWRQVNMHSLSTMRLANRFCSTCHVLGVYAVICFDQC